MEQIKNIRRVGRLSKDGLKTYWTLEWGRHSGECYGTGIFTWEKPSTKFEKDTNRKNEADLDQEETELKQFGPEFKLRQKIRTNFLEFFTDYIEKNARDGNRHLQGAKTQFELFLDGKKIPLEKITEELCEKFQEHLLDKFNGKTPGNYFGRFKEVLAYAAHKGYFQHKVSPAALIKVKNNPSIALKEILSESQYKKIIKSNWDNKEVQRAFIFSLYTGMRWCDVKKIKWSNIADDKSQFSIVQAKTKVNCIGPIHPVAQKYLGEYGELKSLVFDLPTANGCNKSLSSWMKMLDFSKHYTWHSARHSCAVILKKNGVDDATIAGMLGHTTTALVQKIYKRYQVDTAVAAMKYLPAFAEEVA